ncbi:MAG: hypothetical protein Q8P41_00620 [Pseudomonadota bacterium]|nr:hypothetical protein [Pseudomonadota bacterium]
MGVLTRAARLGMLVGAALLAGCTHMSTVTGAIPLEPGTSDFTGELQVSRAPNLISTTTGIPLPTIAGHFRRGLSRDLDLGIHVYPLGLGADLRYRFLEVDGWHFAVAPGFAGIGLPIPSLQYAHLDLSMPVRVERAIGKGWSVAGGPGLVSRQTFINTESESLSVATATFELYAGGGLRLQRTGKRLKLGFSCDVYVDTTRATGLYGGVGFDLGTVARPRARAASDEIETRALAETE